MNIRLLKYSGCIFLIAVLLFLLALRPVDLLAEQSNPHRANPHRAHPHQAHQVLAHQVLEQPVQELRGSAVDGKSSREILKRLSEGVKKVTLSNGMRAVIFRRTQAPVFEGQVWVKVGGVNEIPGTTGVAHMLEHMAFKGSKTIGTKDFGQERELLSQFESILDRQKEFSKNPSLESDLKKIDQELEKLWVRNEFSLMYEKKGGVNLNAATSKDYTYYMVALPKVGLELWNWLESDRLLQPVFREFYREREVVREERRSRVDDSPGGKLYEAMIATAFYSHPNRLPTIGWSSDLAMLRTKDVQDFHKIYYQPNNIVLSLVGDVTPSEVTPMLEKYFGRIPASNTQPPEVSIQEESQQGERRVVIEFDAEPIVMVAYHKPTYPVPDDAHFAVFHSLLSDGRSSILYRELVQKRHLATAVSTSEAPGELYPNLFYVWGAPVPGVKPETLIEEIHKILESFKTTTVKSEDLLAAKKRVRVDLLSTLDSNSGLARTLGHAESLWGNWEVIFEVYDNILSTTAEDIKALAEKYIQRNTRTIGWVEKPKTNDLRK